MESLKIFIVETTHLILSKFHTNIPWVDLYLIPSRDFDPLENIGFFWQADPFNCGQCSDTVPSWASSRKHTYTDFYNSMTKFKGNPIFKCRMYMLFRMMVGKYTTFCNDRKTNYGGRVGYG